ncbi:MAG: FO synthase subunit 2 [Promethearchaeota archaeon]|nr:MAG: FO synthase subunit 2 [Candidatus Lokiarchaeota archaeon]
MNFKTCLKKKTELLSKGVFLKPELMEYYKKEGISFGRKGGAGPLGGRYFLLEDNETLVNVALWDSPKNTNLTLNKKEGGFFRVQNSKADKAFGKIKLVKNPDFYDPHYKTSEGIPMRKIALVHGIDCLATTVYQQCKYWACGEACQFCGIELSLKYDTTIVEKNADQVSEVITQAKKEGRCSHMTLTSGTYDTIDKGAEKYIELLRGLKENHPDIPLHIQIEPLEDLSYLDKLKDAGADTIGIHLETLNEKLREIITPGKAKIPRTLFTKNWKYSVDLFGKNQVESFILLGFEDPPRITVQKIEEVISLGVIPFLTPVRPIPGKKYRFTGINPGILIDLYLETAKLMKKYELNPLKNKAGCVRCGGCSAINEAYKAV